MKKLLLLILCSTLMYAALPPQYQERKDSDALYDYVENNPKVKRTLKDINTFEYTIEYGNSCIIYFQRKKEFHLPGWVGPAADLIFKEDTCAVEDETNFILNKEN